MLLQAGVGFFGLEGPTGAAKEKASDEIGSRRRNKKK